MLTKTHPHHLMFQCNYIQTVWEKVNPLINWVLGLCSPLLSQLIDPKNEVEHICLLLSTALINTTTRTRKECMSVCAYCTSLCVCLRVRHEISWPQSNQPDHITKQNIYVQFKSTTCYGHRLYICTCHSLMYCRSQVPFVLLTAEEARCTSKLFCSLAN